MSFRRAKIVLSLFLVVSVLITWVIFSTLGRGVRGDTNNFSAVFTDVSGLRVGDDVRVAGVRVGRVDGIELLGPDRARVAFEVQSDQQLSGNTKASVVYQNLIGQRYLGLSLGAFNEPAPLEPGAEIPVAHTEPSFDISGMLNGFEPLFSVLDPNKVNDVANAIIGALQGDSGSITTLLAETSTLAKSVAGPDDVLGDVITNLSTVIAGLSRQSGNLQDVISNSQAIFVALAGRRAELMGSVDQIAQVGGRLAQITADIQPQLNEFLTREPGFAEHFNDNKESFAYLGANVPLLLKGLARVSQEGSFINAYVCDFNPLNFAPALSAVVPTIVAAATPGGVAKHSPICQS